MIALQVDFIGFRSVLRFAKEVERAGAGSTLESRLWRKSTLAKLVSEGSSGTIRTISPPLSPLIWTTMMTGVSPLEHRILDFLRVNPVSQQREPITSDERKVPAVWNMATTAGKKVGALGFWATYPAESINGLMVSDRLFTFPFSEKAPPPGVVYPASMESWAREGLTRAQNETGYDAVKAVLPWLTDAEYTQAAAVTDPYAHPVSALRRILIETKVYDDLGRDWLSRERPDLLLLYFQGTDSIGHVFAPYAPPRQTSVSQADYERYKDVPERYFAAIDQMLARFFDQLVLGVWNFLPLGERWWDLAGFGDVARQGVQRGGFLDGRRRDDLGALGFFCLLVVAARQGCVRRGRR
jgi:hypothetical protein